MEDMQLAAHYEQLVLSLSQIEDLCYIVTVPHSLSPAPPESLNTETTSPLPREAPLLIGSYRC